VTGERLCWTGDLGWYRPDAIIELLGREDRQLKVQGFRIEPGEVESAVRDCPGVRDGAVGAVTGPTGQRRLVALAVPEPGAQPDGPAILASGQLPAAVTAERAAPAADLTRVGGRGVAGGLLPDGLKLRDYERLTGVHAHNLAVLGRYRPPPTTVPVLLVSAVSDSGADTTTSWRAVCADRQVQQRPGDHYSIVNPDQLRSVAAYAASWAAAALRG
jgi:acyl-CoA synthetase (AMP-forming)/AMP-acid ligase II